MTGPKAMSREPAKALGKANKAAATGHRSGVGEGTRGQERTPSMHPASEALKLLTSCRPGWGPGNVAYPLRVATVSLFTYPFKKWPLPVGCPFVCDDM